MANFKLLMFVDGLDGMPMELETAGERGGFGLFIHQNDEGLCIPGFAVEGHVEDNGALVVEVRNANGNVVARNRTRPCQGHQGD